MRLRTGALSRARRRYFRYAWIPRMCRLLRHLNVKLLRVGLGIDRSHAPTWNPLGFGRESLRRRRHILAAGKYRLAAGIGDDYANFVCKNVSGRVFQRIFFMLRIPSCRTRDGNDDAGESVGPRESSHGGKWEIGSWSDTELTKEFSLIIVSRWGKIGIQVVYTMLWHATVAFRQISGNG